MTSNRHHNTEYGRRYSVMILLNKLILNFSEISFYIADVSIGIIYYYIDDRCSNVRSSRRIYYQYVILHLNQQNIIFRLYPKTN